MRNILENASTISIETNYRMMSYSRMYAGTASLVGNKLLNDELLVLCTRVTCSAVTTFVMWV